MIIHLTFNINQIEPNYEEIFLLNQKQHSFNTEMSNNMSQHRYKNRTRDLHYRVCRSYRISIDGSQKLTERHFFVSYN